MMRPFHQHANHRWWDERPEWSKTFWQSQQSHDARGWVGDLDIPILGFIGENGQWLPDTIEGWRKQFGMEGVEDLTVVVIHWAGHFMMMDGPEELNPALLAFLNRVLH